MLGRFGISLGRRFGSPRLVDSRAVASFTAAVPLTGFEGGRMVGVPAVLGGFEAGFLGGGRLGDSFLSEPFCFTRWANFEKELLLGGDFEADRWKRQDLKSAV